MPSHCAVTCYPGITGFDSADGEPDVSDAVRDGERLFAMLSLDAVPDTVQSIPCSFLGHVKVWSC